MNSSPFHALGNEAKEWMNTINTAKFNRLSADKYFLQHDMKT